MFIHSPIALWKYGWLALGFSFVALFPMAVSAADAKIASGFSALAEGRSQQALDELNAAIGTTDSAVELEVLRATAALESGKPEHAQLIYRVLLGFMNDPSQKPTIVSRSTRTYQALAVERAKRGLALPLDVDSYKAVQPSMLLNINLNRKQLGLPFIGNVAQWDKFDWMPKLNAEVVAAGNPLATPAISSSIVSPSKVDKPAATTDNGSEEVLLTDKLILAMNQAKQMQAIGKHKEAYELLLLFELEGAGNVDFDYLLGIAAIDSGHADQAIFVLLRVLNQKPKHSGARIELGRAYYANGDYLDSRDQFEKIMKQNPPPAAKSVSEQYLAAIKSQLAATLTTLVPFVDVKLGYSTNANGATADQKPFAGLAGVPVAVQDLALDPNSVEQGSTLLAVSTGLSYSRQFIPRWFVKAGGQISGQANPSAHFVDTHGLNGYANIEKRVGDDYFSGGIDMAKSYVDHAFSADVIGLNFIAGSKLTAKWSGIVQLRSAVSNYNDAQAAAKDSNDFTFAVNASRAAEGTKQVQYSLGLIGQRVSANSAENSKDVVGLSGGLVMLPWPSTLMTLSAAYINAEFDAPVLGSADRTDKTAILGLGFIRPAKFDPNLKWSLRLDANNTSSTLNLFDADTVKLTVGGRYDFQ